MSTTNEAPKALSANASSFNPPSSEQIWGAISQSFGGGANPTAESGPRPPSSNGGGSGGGHGGSVGGGGGHGHHHNRTSSHHSSHGTPPQGGAGGGGETSGLGLWNFGGFGDEAKTRPAPQAGRGGMLDDSNVNLDFMGDHGNKVSMCIYSLVYIKRIAF